MSYYSEDDYDDDTAEYGRPRTKRRIGMILLSSGVAVVLIACGAVFALAKGHNQDRTTPAAATSRDASPSALPSVAAPPSVEAVVSSAPPSPSPSKPPSPTRAKKSVPPPPKETKLPPPPPVKTAPAGCVPTYKGTQLPKPTVRGYLDKASTYQFWGTVRGYLDKASTYQFWGSTEAYVDIRVPKRLLYAVADQESGWQSNIYACDGGAGVMQIMPDTATWLNQRFGTSWKRDTPADNVMLGGQYLAWLFAYYGHILDDNYDVTQPLLLKAVISAYNWGTAGVDVKNGVYPNPQYVQNVMALRDTCCAGY